MHWFIKKTRRLISMISVNLPKGNESVCINTITMTDVYLND